MIFDLGTINWQAISAVLTFFAVLGAYLLPAFKDRSRIKIKTSFKDFKDISNTLQVHLFIINKSRQPVSIVAFGLTFFGKKEKTVLESKVEKPETIMPRDSIHLLKNIKKDEFENVRSIYVLDGMHKMWKEGIIFRSNLKKALSLPMRKSQPHLVH